MLYAAIILSLAIIGGGTVYIKKTLSANTVSERTEIQAHITEAEEEIETLSKYVDSYASKGQFDTLIDMIDSVKSDLENEKNALVAIEGKLDTAQKSVEEKEALQQEIKSAKEADEEAVNNLLAEFSVISDQSISLEQKLAASLKNLDRMLEELDLNDDQRGVLGELSKQLTDAGSLFRDLITEYSGVNERLEMLKQQHVDLEDEYTKLVEQQLGE